MAHINTHNFETWLELARKSDYRAGALAKSMNLLPRQLRRQTQKAFGCSPQVWLNVERLRVAAAMLKQNHSVKFIAYELGYKQASHFSAQFKRYYGFSPIKSFQIQSK